jgi:hypothetical protein
MALEAHLTELRDRHRELDRKIEVARMHPATDDIEIKTLKRKKLHLKEEIVRLDKTIQTH